MYVCMNECVIPPERQLRYGLQINQLLSTHKIENCDLLYFRGENQEHREGQSHRDVLILTLEDISNDN